MASGLTLPVNAVEERSANANRECPVWVEREIQKIGGMENGRPRFRVVWGGSRWTAGVDGKTLIRPYRLDMWHIEKLHEGEYEHVYRLGECPGPAHRKTEKDQWCRQCFVDGGVPLEPDRAFGVIEGAIRLLLRTEELQRSTIFKAQQRDALFARENAKDAAAPKAINEAMQDARPASVKRSFETPLRETSQQAMGTTGFKQLGAREIARGLRKKRRA
ncbi:MAG: hypothetical protein ACRD8A_12685 [Candidatus Acidiferrales bacterium]